MAIRITNDMMTLEIDNRVVATARYKAYAAADGNGAWIVSTCPARLFTCDQAVTALTIAEPGFLWRGRSGSRERPFTATFDCGECG